MVPAAVVDADASPSLAPLLERGRHDHRRRQFVLHRRHPARQGTASAKGIDYVDVGTSGGVWGLERGYCMMIGGPDAAVQRLDPIFKTLAPGIGDIPRTAGRDTGRRHGRARAICTAVPAARATSSRWSTTASSTASWPPTPKGSAFCRAANVGKRTQTADAETTPLRDPEHYQYDFDLPDVAEVWRRGSVIASWLLDLTADRAGQGSRSSRSSRAASPIRAKAAGPIKAAIDEAVPAPVLTDGALPALQLARRGGVSEQAAVRDALSSSAGISRKQRTALE